MARCARIGATGTRPGRCAEAMFGSEMILRKMISYGMITCTCTHRTCSCLNLLVLLFSLILKTIMSAPYPIARLADSSGGNHS